MTPQQHRGNRGGGDVGAELGGVDLMQQQGLAVHAPAA
jgi:hypothetical protein